MLITHKKKKKLLKKHEIKQKSRQKGILVNLRKSNSAEINCGNHLLLKHRTQLFMDKLGLN